MSESLLPEESIFEKALGMESPAERAAFLDQACGDNQTLRAKIEVLLHANERSGDLLDLFEKFTTTLADQVTESPGMLIGPYKLLEQIGEGGFGIVFVAEQTTPVRRKVALKVLKPGLDTRQVVARFEAERQTLAILDHPNIAKVFDGGVTASGRPYFVMELVKGVPITDFCDQNHFTPRQRLELIVSVCRAVQHAHQKGIIHRDLKPSNVLVMMDDATPMVKVIDFGVAKALGQELTDKTLYTGFAQIIGTPLYMSPEQAGQSAVDIDTRGDIYSLGVVLYELLTGSTPFDKERLKQAGFDEMRCILREEEPPKPSTRLSESVETLPAISAQRQMEAAKLTKLVRGELDWIVMKCLEKDRNRRYETATALAADVERYLNDEPVQACPPSGTYRFGKFARRNKTALAAALVVVAALLGGTAVATWQAVRATHAKAAALVEKQRADAEAGIANSITGYFQQMFGSIEPGMGKGLDYTVRQLLDDYESDLEKKLPGPPEVEATLHATLGRAYACLGQSGKARKHLARALVLRRSAFGDQHEKFADSLVDYARPDASDPSERPDPEGEVGLRRALAIYKARGVGGRPLVYALRILQWLLIEEAYAGVPGKWREVEQVSLEALAEARKSPGVEFPETALILGGFAEPKIVEGQYAEAEQLARESLAMHIRLIGPEHIETGWRYYILAKALRHQNKFQEALQADLQALTIMRRVLPPEKRGIALALTAVTDTLERAKDSHALADLFPSLGQLADLQSMFRQVLTTTKPAMFNNDDPAVVAVHGLARFSEIYLRLGQELASRGKTKEAEESRQKADLALETLQTQLAGNSDLLPYGYAYSAVALMQAGRPEQAKELCRKLLAHVTPKRGWAHNDVAWFLANDEVPAHRDPALAIALAKKAAESDPQSSSYRRTLGVARYRAGDWKGAISALENAASLGNTGNSLNSYFLAMAHWQLGEKEKSRVLHDRGVEQQSGQAGADEELQRFRAESAELLGINQ